MGGQESIQDIRKEAIQYSGVLESFSHKQYTQKTNPVCILKFSFRTSES